MNYALVFQIFPYAVYYRIVSSGVIVTAIFYIAGEILKLGKRELNRLKKYN